MPRDFQEVIKLLPGLTRKSARYDEWKAENGFVDVEDLPIPPPTAVEQEVPPSGEPEEDRNFGKPRPQYTGFEEEEPPRRLHTIHRPIREVVSEIRRKR